MKVGSALQIIGLLFLLVAVVAADGQQQQQQPRRDEKAIKSSLATTFNNQRANMNDYTDYVMVGVVDWMRNGGVVPFDLPDLREGFSYSPLLIEYSGWVDLSNGKFLDMEKVIRAGDCYMSYDRLLLRVEISAAMTAMTFTYDYVTTIMGLGVFEGYVEGAAENIVIECEFLIDMYDFYIYMQGFQVTSIGSIDVRLRGNLLTDWIGNIMINIITTLFRTTVTQMVSDRVKVFVQDTLDDINAARQVSRQPGNDAQMMFEALRAAMAKKGIQLPAPFSG